MEEKLITVAIHTYDYAVALRDMLARGGVHAMLENVDISNPSPACGVRVRIPMSSLPAALRLIENDPTQSEAKVVGDLSDIRKIILVPTDFSPASLDAVKVAFSIASSLSVEILLLHVYATPYYDGTLSTTDTFTIDAGDAVMRHDLEKAAEDEMERFKRKVALLIEDRRIPPVKYSAQIREGLPEDVILDFCRQSPPELLVMGTRPVVKKAAQMLGSVTAEVLDACRIPVFTVPEGYEFHGFQALSPLVYFCNVDQHDLIAMDTYLSLLPTRGLKICLVPVNDKAGSKLAGRMEALKNYFTRTYPDNSFYVEIPPQKDFRGYMEKLAERDNFKLIVVPNKKKNILSRLFNPGIPHRIIFERDMPMLALPV